MLTHFKLCNFFSFLLFQLHTNIYLIILDVYLCGFSIHFTCVRFKEYKEINKKNVCSWHSFAVVSSNVTHDTKQKEKRKKHNTHHLSKSLHNRLKFRLVFSYQHKMVISLYIFLLHKVSSMSATSSNFICSLFYSIHSHETIISVYVSCKYLARVAIIWNWCLKLKAEIGFVFLFFCFCGS